MHTIITVVSAFTSPESPVRLRDRMRTGSVDWLAPASMFDMTTSSMDRVKLRNAADMMPGIGFYDVKLNSYTPPREDTQGITGLDAIDQWAVGFLKEGVFYAQDLSSRLKKLPKLNDMLLLPQLRGTPAIMTVDVWGNSAVWVEDE